MKEKIVGQVLQGETALPLDQSSQKLNPIFLKSFGFFIPIRVRASELEALISQSTAPSIHFSIKQMSKSFKNGMTHVLNVSTSNEHPQTETRDDEAVFLATLHSTLDDFSFVIGRDKIKCLPRYRFGRRMRISFIASGVNGTIKVGHIK